MAQASDAREVLAAEMARRVAALPRGRREVVTVVEPEVLAFERRRARKAVRARRWVGGLSLVSAAGMAVGAAVIAATLGRVTRDEEWALFWAGWAVAAVAAIGSGAVIARNWSLLSGATIAVGLLPWVIVSAFAAVVGVALM